MKTLVKTMAVALGVALLTAGAAHAQSSTKGAGAGKVGAVPEPATWAMMLVGFGGVGAALRRRRAPHTA